jgi:hypothetical protein
MKYSRILLISVAVLIASFAVSVPAAYGKPNEFEQIAKHLKLKYRAKKVSIPFLWLARAAVRVAKPAGVKSFNITLFENLQFSKETLDVEMQSMMRSSFGPEWDSIFHVRSRQGQQVYMYMREDGRNIKLALVTVDDNKAAVIRATFSPDRLAEFINDPKIFGISLGDGQQPKNAALPGKTDDN